MATPLLSIIIPTKNRYGTLCPVVEILLDNIEGDDYEIVIQDNSYENAIAEKWVRGLNNDRIKYFYTAQTIDIVQNVTLALENSIGEYLIVIGDDDFVSPYILEITNFLKSHDIKCLMYSAGYYWWDSVEFVKESEFFNKKTYWEPLNINFELVRMESKNELDYVLSQGGITYYRLPRLYHGLVKREILDNIKKRIGTYLIGISPDMGFSVEIALTVDHYYFINYPVSVFGASKNSGGGWTASKTHFGKIEEVEFLPRNSKEGWDPLLPKIWSEQITYAQTIYNVFKSFHVDLKINYEMFYASMIANEMMLYSYAKPVIKQYFKNNLIKYINLYRKAAFKIFIRKSRIFRFKVGMFKFKKYDQLSINGLMLLLKKLGSSGFIVETGEMWYSK
jgi:hypothetical protein